MAPTRTLVRFVMEICFALGVVWFTPIVEDIKEACLLREYMLCGSTRSGFGVCVGYSCLSVRSGIRTRCMFVLLWLPVYHVLSDRVVRKFDGWLVPVTREYI